MGDWVREKERTNNNVSEILTGARQGLVIPGTAEIPADTGTLRRGLAAVAELRT